MSRKVLIVEDCSDLLDLLGEALALLGWETILAESGRAAMSKLERDLPGVVLVDMRMAAMDGVELATTLKTHPVYKNIPILAASGYSGGLTPERCFALGCDDFISTPFALPALETRLTNLMSVERLKTIRQQASESGQHLGVDPDGFNTAFTRPAV